MHNATIYFIFHVIASAMWHLRQNIHFEDRKFPFGRPGVLRSVLTRRDNHVAS